MNRFSPLAIWAIFAAVGGGLFYYGWNQKTEIAPIAADTSITCAELLEQSPEETAAFRLTDFKPGKHYVAYDENEDGEWEQVVVPMFPSKWHKLGKNYNAVLLHFGDVHNFEELQQRLQHPEIPVRFRIDRQEVDGFTYDRLAKHYTSMNFEKNVSVFSGYPKGGDVADLFLVGGGFFVLVSFLFGAWQSVGLITGTSEGRPAEAAEFDGIELVSSELLQTDTDKRDAPVS